MKDTREVWAPSPGLGPVARPAAALAIPTLAPQTLFSLEVPLYILTQGSEVPAADRAPGWLRPFLKTR